MYNVIHFRPNCLLMTEPLSDQEAQELMQELPNHSFIIGGLFCQSDYFYWKDGGGKAFRVQIGGGQPQSLVAAPAL